MGNKGVGSVSQRNYRNILNAFYNLKDEERQYIYTNFSQIEESYTQFLKVFKSVDNESSTHEDYLLESKIEMLNLRN